MAMENKNTIFVLRHADVSLVGLVIDGWKVSAAHRTPEGEDDYLANDLLLFPLFERVLSCQESFGSMVYLNKADNPFYVYLRKETEDIFSIDKVINTLRLFKSSNIGLSRPILFNNRGGSISNAFQSYVLPYNTENIPLVLNEEEKSTIANIGCLNAETANKQVSKMLDVFHESFKVENEYLSFVLRIMVLEMLIGAQHEVSNRITRGVAVLLGKSLDESIQIGEACKKMYEARSRYLHEGQTDGITKERQHRALDYSRRVIANLLYCNADISAVRKCLHQSGFGSNPYNIYF